MEQAVVPLPERLDKTSVEALLARLTAVTAPSVVVLEGIDGRFCLGMDFIGALAPVTESTCLRERLKTFAYCLRHLMLSSRPTLAVVDGPALGGGLGLAAACDFVLASERARFGLPEALYGLAPAIIRPALLRRISPQRVNLLLVTCHSRSADEAQALGLVDRVVPADRLQQARAEVVRQMCRARTETVAASRRWSHDEIDHALRCGVEETAAALGDQRVVAALRLAALEEDMPWNR